MNDLKTKIETLEKAIESAATPEAQRQVMRERLQVLEEKYAEAIQKEQDALQKKEIVLTQFFRAQPFEKAYSSVNGEDGYCKVKTAELNESATEITVTVAGMAPVVDDEDDIAITKAVKKLTGLDAKVKVGDTNYTVTYAKPIVTIKDKNVSGVFVLKLSDTLKK